MSLQPALDLASFSALSKSLAGVLAGGFLLQLVAPSTKQYLALIAGRTLPFVWNTVTSGLLEDTFVSALAYCVAVPFLLRIVEPVYGAREVLRFLACVLFVTGTTTFLLVFLLYVASLDQAKAGALLYTEICGFHGAFAALLVAVKQLIPENEVALFGGLAKFRAKHLAGLYVLLMVALGALAGQALKLIPFAVLGAYYGWLYLRFWQYKGEGIRGDLSEDFSFASFFPEPVQPIISQVVAPLASFLRLGLAGRAGAAGQGGGGSSSSAAGRGYTLAGSAVQDDADAARRRERGVKALEERLGLTATGAPAASAASAGDIEAPAPPAERS